MKIGNIVVVETNEGELIKQIENAKYNVEKIGKYFKLIKKSKNNFKDLYGNKIFYDSVSHLEIIKNSDLIICKFHGNINYMSILSKYFKDKFTIDDCSLENIDLLLGYSHNMYYNGNNTNVKNVIKKVYDKNIEVLLEDYKDLIKNENYYKPLLKYIKSENLDINNKSSETVYNKKMSEKLGIILTDRNTNNKWRIEKSDLYDKDDNILYHNGKTSKIRDLCMQILNSAKYIKNKEQQDTDEFQNITGYVIGIIQESNITNNNMYSLITCTSIIKELYEYNIYINLIEYEE